MVFDFRKVTEYSCAELGIRHFDVAPQHCIVPEPGRLSGNYSTIQLWRHQAVVLSISGKETFQTFKEN